MTKSFKFDVFLSHSSLDKTEARALAEALAGDGLRVWFDEWEIKPGDHILSKVEDGLERSRVLVLCMSKNAIRSDWASLEASTFRFRDPLNKERRFVPIRLDGSKVKSSLRQFLFLDYFGTDRKGAYQKLLEVCQPSHKSEPFQAAEGKVKAKPTLRTFVQVWPGKQVHAYAFDRSGTRALLGRGDLAADATTDPTAPDGSLQLWDSETGRLLFDFGRTGNRVESIQWTRDERFALTASPDGLLELWDVNGLSKLKDLKGHSDFAFGISLSPDDEFVLSSSFDKTIRLWSLRSGTCLRIYEGHSDRVRATAWCLDQQQFLSCADDNTIRLWDVVSGECLEVFRGHTYWVLSVQWSPDQKHFISGSCDTTIRLWDLDSGRCLRVFEGHASNIEHLVWSPDGRYIASGSPDRTVRVWSCESGECVEVFHVGERQDAHVRFLTWRDSEGCLLAGDLTGGIYKFDVGALTGSGTSAGKGDNVHPPEQVQYTNAKVMLVGESSAGKSGLSRVLTGKAWEPTDSTLGAWATQWTLPGASVGGVEREIWLWDFGGQADQRLIHQLYMDDAALAVLVFDGQKEDLFETLRQWDRELARSSSRPLVKLLVAGRIDAGGLRCSREQLSSFASERDFQRLIETSAKESIGIDDLRRAILDSIPWDEIPCRTTLVLYRHIKEGIVALRDSGRVLMRFNELRDALIMGWSPGTARFSDEELHAVISLLAGPGLLWELNFGSLILLQPERINSYAQAVIQTLRMDADERGCLPESQVLEGRLTFPSTIDRLPADDERIILQAMLQSLLQRGICLTQQTDMGGLLIFPSYYRREREELIKAPAILVSYKFEGYLDEVYASLVVRLHHTKAFQQNKLWRYAADFATLTGKQLGLKLTRLSDGIGELAVYFDLAIPMEERIIFSRYVHEHLLQYATTVERMRHYVCPHCGVSAGNHEVAMRKLAEGKKDIPCINCDSPSKRIPLWDQMEDLFASSEIKQRVNALQKQSAHELDNESKERALVGEVISTVALAGQISREFNVSDHGIDMEVEFKTDAGTATGQKIYLQLKSGDSYLRRRSSDGAEIFSISKERHLNYWMQQDFPVFLVIRNSEGEVRWMEIRDFLRKESQGGAKAVRQFAFNGERFDVMSVRNKRPVQ